MIQCPWCQEPVAIDAVNCGVFRHAMFRVPRRRSRQQYVDPHMGEQRMLALVAMGAVFGCGMPFRIKNNKAERAGWDS